MKSTLCLCAWLAVLICASGCKHFEARPLSADRAADAFQSRSLNDSGLRAFIATNAPTLASNWPPSSWDLPLLTMAAFYYHPDLEMARAKLAAAEAAIITAGARPNPTFAFSPSYSGPPLEFFSPWTLGFMLDVPVETAGKRGHRIAQARRLANAARLNVVSVAWQVRSRVRGALLDWRAASLNEELLAKQESAQNKAVELLEGRFKAGQAPLSEVQLVRVAAAQTALQLRDAQRQSGQAHVRLADAIGVPECALTNVSLSVRPFDDLPVPQHALALRREALLHRADILGALAEYEASQAALQLEIARQYPDIHLGPGYTGNQGVNNYSLDFSLTLPVLDQNQGPIAEAEAHRREAAAAFTALQARATGELDAAFAGYHDALAKLKTADALLVARRERMQSTQRLFEAGASDHLEVLQTQTELYSGELQRASDLIEAQQALGALEDALQRPIEDTVIPGSHPVQAEKKSN